MRRQKLGGGAACVLVVTAGALAYWAARPGFAQVSVTPAAAEPRPAAGPRYVGAVSCAAAACHNANGPRGSRGSEYTTWITTDPHRNAYAVLLAPRSQRIEKNLGTRKEAAQDILCLNCHVHPDMDASLAAVLGGEGDRFQTAVGFGFGCESCHGPAERWLTTHYLNGWSGKDQDEKRRAGMHPMRDLGERAQTCAACHVGSGDRDVNHDLIAAGHPRLNFEFAAYLAVLPKHWDALAEQAADPAQQARAWAIGQAVSAKAALELLAHRAGGSGPWPEFAELDCFSCHHDLVAKSWRQQRDLRRLAAAHGKNVDPGALPWGTWYTALLSQGLKPDSAGARPTAIPSIEAIRTEMTSAHPNRRKVGALAADAGRTLHSAMRRLAKAPLGERCVHDLFAGIAKDEPAIAAASWDGAAQVYLALAALYQARGELNPRQRDSRLKADLERMGRLLEFPGGGDARYDGPEEDTYPGRQSQFLSLLAHIEDLGR
jgi:hypothetical protein